MTCSQVRVVPNRAPMTTTKYGDKWNEDETILAFELYCRIPFRLTKRTTPSVIELANLLGRTPSSAAKKLGNFGSFDPKLAERGVTGLSHASKLDLKIWSAFQNDWESLVMRASDIRQKMELEIAPEKPISGRLDTHPSVTEVLHTRRERVGQQFFRESVLSSYNSQCCISGLDIPECLIASHIVPWRECVETRLDPANGLCLSATFDRLFDRFLITVELNFVLIFSIRLRESKNREVVGLVRTFDGKEISQPERFVPKPVFLQLHNDRFTHLNAMKG